jgi:hypothetical protein
VAALNALAVDRLQRILASRLTQNDSQVTATAGTTSGEIFCHESAYPAASTGQRGTLHPGEMSMDCRLMSRQQLGECIINCIILTGLTEYKDGRKNDP